MRVVYGIELHEPQDKYYTMVEQIAHTGAEIAVPGRFLVEAIPQLRYLPAWVPGGGFKRWAAEAKRNITNALNSLFESAMVAMVSLTRRFPYTCARSNVLRPGSGCRERLYGDTLNGCCQEGRQSVACPY